LAEEVALIHKVPRATERFLVTYGGKNPFGGPQWRMVVGTERMVKEAGVYRDWAPGLSTAEKGGLNFSPNPNAPGCNFTRHDNKPLRVVTEKREVVKYPHAAGWILEKWFPASSYGTQADWYSFVAIDGVTPCLGPYPECGDYEMIFGPWAKVPTTDVLQGLISQYCHKINSRRGTAQSRAEEYLLRYQYEEEQAEAKRKVEYEALMADHLSPLSSTSLAASRWRQDLARRTGNSNEHIGIL
jgi:hypothetical protein